MTGERHSSRSGKEAGVKYLLLIYHNPQARQIWESFSEEQKSEGLALYAALNNDLAASGELIVAEALEDPSRATRVTVTDGQTVAGDGPYAETKEHLAGIYLVECASLERAVEIAGRIPEAAIGGVEVRPILTYSALEM
jgi:hypothetical protein